MFRCKFCDDDLIRAKTEYGTFWYSLHHGVNAKGSECFGGPAMRGYHEPALLVPAKAAVAALSGPFRCRCCREQIWTDGTYHYSSSVLTGGRKAFWHDQYGLYYCLSGDNEYIVEHVPLKAEIAASLDAVMTGQERAEVEWRDEMGPAERLAYENMTRLACKSRTT